MATVRNQATGRALVLPALTALQAVRWAWFQSQGIPNTEDYDTLVAPVQYGARSIVCGDWFVGLDYAALGTRV